MIIQHRERLVAGLRPTFDKLVWSGDITDENVAAVLTYAQQLADQDEKFPGWLQSCHIHQAVAHHNDQSQDS